MSEKLQFFKGNTEQGLDNLAKNGGLVIGALYHCLDTGNTYIAINTTEKKLFSTTNSGVTKVSIVRWGV